MAPLTLLVGENSTGKTSFLAILRALWEVAVNEVVPDFRREPYDLGAFSEIVYNDSSRGDQPVSFHAGFRDSDEELSFHFTFQDVDGVVYPVSRYASVGDISFEVVARPEQSGEIRFGIEDRSWKRDFPPVWYVSGRESLLGIASVVRVTLHMADQNGPADVNRDAGEQHGGLSPLGEDDKGRVIQAHLQLENWQLDRSNNLGQRGDVCERTGPPETKADLRPVAAHSRPRGRVRAHVPREYVTSRPG